VLVASPEEGLPFVSFADVDLVESVAEVNVSEYLGLLELIQRLGGLWCRSTILDSDSIERSIVDHRSGFPLSPDN
jgi:hypothetical protein